MNRLFYEATAIMTRPVNKKQFNFVIPKWERRKIVNTLGDSACLLYNHYCTADIRSADDLKDEHIAEDIGWTTRKVAKYRVMLQKAGYVCIRNLSDTKTHKAYVHCILGLEKNALYAAGLPYDTRNNDLFNKAKNQLSIEHEDDVVERIEEIKEVMIQLLRKEQCGK